MTGFLRRTGWRLIVAVAASVALTVSTNAVVAEGGNDLFDPAELSNANDWRQVNSVPFETAPQVNVLCAAPAAARPSDPHASSAITVFVNRVGTDAMFSAAPIAFPPGSVIVKKKIDPRAATGEALLYTVMVKHEAGYDASTGDWEFAVVAANGRDVEARGALANCIACHQPQRASDYVFRTYLGH
jgi:hypothetical protein